MGDGDILRSERSCGPGFRVLRHLNIESSGELGEALLDSYAAHILEEGQDICCVPSAAGMCRWYVYESERAAAEVAECPPSSAVESDFWDDVSSVAAIAGVAALFGLVLWAMGRSILDSVDEEQAFKERAEVEAVRPTSVEVPPREPPYVLDDGAWEQSDWFKRLNEHDQAAVRMVIEQDLSHSLESEVFRRLYLDAEGDLTAAGIRYLIDVRGGNLMEGTDMRVGRIRLGRRGRRERRGEASSETVPLDGARRIAGKAGR
jgi:hypothetical protein